MVHLLRHFQAVLLKSPSQFLCFFVWAVILNSVSAQIIGTGDKNPFSLEEFDRVRQEQSESSNSPDDALNPNGEFAAPGRDETDHIVRDLRLGLARSGTVTKELAWHPLYIRLATNDEQVFEGRLEVWFESKYPDLAVLPVDLPAVANKEYTIYVKKPASDDPLLIDLVAKNGTRIEQYGFYPPVAARSWPEERVRLPFQHQANSMEPLVLVLEDESKSLPTRGPLGEARSAQSNAGLSRTRSPKRLFHPTLTGRLVYDFRQSRFQFGPSLTTIIPGAAGPIQNKLPDGLSKDEQAILSRDDSVLFRNSLERRSLIMPFQNPAAREEWYASNFFHDAGTDQLYSFPKNFASTFARHFFNLTYLKADQERLPTHPFGYDPFTAILVEDWDPSSATAAQREALVQWVESGGILILAAGGREKWGSTWLEELAPVFPTGDARRQIVDPREVNATPLRLLGRNLVRLSEAVPKAGVTDVVSINQRPALARWHVGAGLVTYVGFSLVDFAERGGFFRDRDPFLHYLMPPHRPRTVSQLHVRNALSSLTTARLSAEPGRVGVDVIFFLGIVFLVLSVPVNLWFCRRYKKTVYAWPILIGVCLSSTLLISLWVSIGALKSIPVRQIEWVEADLGQRRARATAFFGFSSGYPQNLKWSLDNGNEPAPFYYHQSPDGYATSARSGLIFTTQHATHQFDMNDLRSFWDRDDADQPITPKPLRIRLGTGTNHLAAADYLADLEGTIEVQRTGGDSIARDDAGNIQMFTPGVPRMTVTNNLPHALKNPLLQTPNGRLMPLPDIAPGEALAIDEREALGIDSFIETAKKENPAMLDRLAHLRPDALARKQSIARLLLGITDSNADFYSRKANDRLTINLLQGQYLGSGLTRLRYYDPSSQPDLAYMLSAELEEPLGRLKTDPANVDLESQSILLLRIPVRSIDGTPYSLSKTTRGEIDRAAIK